MADAEARVREEIVATIDRADFALDPEAIRVDVTDAFRRTLGDCRQLPASERAGTPRYRIRIASRLFDADTDHQWRDTVRHEVAHAHVFATAGADADPHGDAWTAAARRAGADPSARYEGDSLVDADYVLACPTGCFEREYVQRSKRVTQPWEYVCGECNARLVSYDVGDRPANPDPGTCYVASLSRESDD